MCQSVVMAAQIGPPAGTWAAVSGKLDKGDWVGDGRALDNLVRQLCGQLGRTARPDNSGGQLGRTASGGQLGRIRGRARRQVEYHALFHNKFRLRAEIHCQNYVVPEPCKAN